MTFIHTPPSARGWHNPNPLQSSLFAYKSSPDATRIVNPDDRPRISDAQAESLLKTIERLIKIGDDADAQHVAELEKTIAGLHEVLRALATQVLKLAEIGPLSDPDDRVVVQGVIEEA